MNQNITSITDTNFAAVDLGKFTELQKFVFTTSRIPLEIEGKVFLKDLLSLTSCEISCNYLPPKTSVPFYHKHRLNEEIYIFIKGKGEFQVDERIFAISEGTIVRVDPEGERCIRNNSIAEDLCWITIQSRVGSHPDGTIEDGYGVDRRVSWTSK